MFGGFGHLFTSSSRHVDTNESGRQMASWAPRKLAGFAAAFVLILTASAAHAQTRFSYSSGQPLEPAYEGWMENKDGSFTMYFGYQNTNWQQEFDIPVGPENSFSPAPVDQGQPTVGNVVTYDYYGTKRPLGAKADWGYHELK